jgi:diguanylate cyclase (GGDEF)-like protein/PAS domain S-box-containing protein
MNQADQANAAAPPPSVRLLVVEDDGVVARDVERSLEEMGYEVADVVPKGEWALEAAREHRPDMVLMDIRLAGDMDGVEAGSRILEELDVPVVYLTAYADDETRSRVRDTTPFGYVVKPFTDRDLRTTVEVALIRHRLETELEVERARLAERVKEQSCLYDVSRLLHADDRALDERLQAVVERLPRGWQYPEITVARLRLDGRSYRSGPFPDSDGTLRAPVTVDGEPVGEVEVAYREERPPEDVGPFLAEESRLLDEVAERVSSEIGRIRIEREKREARRESERQRRTLSRILETAAEGIVLADADGVFRYANPAAEEILGVDAGEIEGRACDDPEWEVDAPDGGPFPTERLPVGRALRGADSVRGTEYGLVRPDGSRVVVSVNAEPIVDADGELSGVVASIRDVTDKKEFEAQLQERALHDYLTGLPNRALLHDRLDHALDRAERVGEALAVLFVDLKRFKLVNDSLGHDAGDQVLEEVAARLDDAVRGPDTVARVGGDEFVVLLEDVVGEADAVEVAQRLVEVFGTPIPVDDREVAMEASVGVIVHEGGRGEEMDGSELVRRADAAMYRAKERPGTHYAVADPAAEPAPSARLEREARLREALEEGGIRTVYQPIYAVGSGGIRGVEALARWNDPDLGEVPPGTFIPIAEETGLILRLGQQQLERACSQLLEDGFGGPGGGPLRLHVNLSARQLDDPDVVKRTRRILESTGFPPERLCLEITESAAVRQPETVERLKEVGVGLAIDDFGTRYSTLSQVRRLRVDALKIDRTFIDGLPDDEKDRAIVETILTLGRSLGLSVVAEGIESDDQLRVLRELGCDEAQGFHLARPCPPEELRGLLATEVDGDAG